MSTKAKSKTNLSSSRSKSRSSKMDLSEDEEETMKLPDQFSWKILSQDHVIKLKTLTLDELTSEMAKILSLHKYKVDLQQAAILDFYVTAYVFAQENSFTNEQISSFFTLLHKLIENIRDKHLSLTDNMQQLRKYLSGIGVSQQTSLNCFTLDITQTCLTYISTTIFQHYNLFEYLFQETQDDEVIQAKYTICQPPELSTHCPAPLEESVTEDFYNHFINPPPTPLLENQERDEETASLFESVGLNVTSEDIKTFMQDITTNAIESYQDQLTLKLKERETTYLAKLAKIEKDIK